MKNVRIIVKLRRLIKSFAVSLILLFIVFAGTAFTSDRKGVFSSDPTSEKSGFKSLFAASFFDPSKPYVTQLNPQAVPFVQSYLRSEGPRLEKMKIWGMPYFNMYDGILAQYGLPKELKYLSVIESDLVPTVVSPAGAVGSWQIMASEAQRMGLKVTGRTDERTNVYKSTHAAAKILKELHSRFHDWLLVVAAYNCGAGRLRQAIRESGSSNFWDLQYKLPEETRNHVKRFIGTHYIFEGNGGLTTMTASEIQDQDSKTSVENKKTGKLRDANYSSIAVSGKLRAGVVARILNMEPAMFNTLNPNFDKITSAGKVYNLTLPINKLTAFEANKNVILAESVQAMLKS